VKRISVLGSIAAGVLSLVAVAETFAQPITVPARFEGSVPTGEASQQVLMLSLADAVARGLEHNLGVLAQEQGVREARGTRLHALGELLPSVDGRVSETRQVVNLAAFGFKGFGDLPQVVGPFNVFDARVSLSQPLLDLSALNDLRAQDSALKAEQFELQDARKLVVLVVTNLYLEAVTGASRLDAVRAQLQTAEALYRQASDLKTSGLVAASTSCARRSNKRPNGSA
jgi:outer membrane protein TolC